MLSPIWEKEMAMVIGFAVNLGAVLTRVLLYYN